MNNVLFSSNRMDWETPQDLFDKLDKEFSFDTAEIWRCTQFSTIPVNGGGVHWG